MERANHITRGLSWAVGLSFVLGLLASVTGAAITIEMVTVGDAGNVGELSGRADLGTERLCGAVPYIYQIGTYEVTNAQYRAFLNSVARYGDPYGLYNTGVAWNLYGGVQRTGAGTPADPYVYTPKNNDPNWENKPVNYVSWYDCLRFINWLQNGQPIAEAGPGVTETGTYTFSDPSTVSIPDHAALTTPHYVLPTEDEWYKAAYYKAGGTAAGYWDYATQSDELPNNNPPESDTGNSANYQGPGYAVGPPYYMTDVGAYSLSVSAYGTYDQAGNVHELLEELLPGNEVHVRDSSWSYNQDGLHAGNRLGFGPPEVQGGPGGVRVALVPEPSVVSILVTLATLSCLRRRPRNT